MRLIATDRKSSFHAPVANSSPVPDTTFARTIQDYDGNDYDVIVINNKEYIMQNFRAVHYADGEPIPNVTDPSNWNNDTSGAYRDYDNNIENSSVYGRLYNWFAGQNIHLLPYFTFEGIQEEGWRLPTAAEYNELIAYLGGGESAYDHLREVGTDHWNTADDEDNSTGFTALPAGYYEAIDDGIGGLVDQFTLMSIMAYFWTSTEYDETTAFDLTLGAGDSIVGESDRKNLGRSIRCVRDLT